MHQVTFIFSLINDMTKCNTITMVLWRPSRRLPFTYAWSFEAFFILSSPSQANSSHTMIWINNKHTLNSMKWKHLHEHWFHSKLFKWDHSICKTSCLIYQFKYACFHMNHRCPITYMPLFEFHLHCCFVLELDCLYNNTSFWLFIST
jgi:hypothetical protein